MSVAKIIEVISEGKTIEEAMQAAIKEAGKTVRGIKQINVDHIEGLVEGNSINKFRVNSRISFVIEH